MAVETSLQHMTTITESHFLLIYFAQTEGKSIYFRSGKSEAAGDSCEVYHINRLKEIIGDALRKHAEGVSVLRSCANAFTAVSPITIDPSVRGRQLRQRADKFVKLLARRSENLTGG